MLKNKKNREKASLIHVFSLRKTQITKKKNLFKTPNWYYPVFSNIGTKLSFVSPYIYIYIESSFHKF